MTTYSSTFSAAGQKSSNLTVPVKSGYFYSLSSSDWTAGVVELQKRVGQSGWETIARHIADSAMKQVPNAPGQYRLLCSGYTATITYVIGDYLSDGKREFIILPASGGKVGATSGWVPAGATDLALATLPAAQTAATLVVPVRGLKVGDVIKSFSANGQIESAGNTASITVALKKTTAAAADVTEGTVATADALSVTADAIISDTNCYKEVTTPDVVAKDETFFFLITATTAASTDIALQSLVLEVLRA